VCSSTERSVVVVTGVVVVGMVVVGMVFFGECEHLGG
jgi:hypothetical protein